MADPRAELATELDKLRGGYLERLPAELAALAELANRLTGSEADRPLLDELYHNLHKLTGSGGIFGFKQLSQGAQSLEKTAKEWLRRDLATIAAAERKRFTEGVAALSATLETARHVADPFVFSEIKTAGERASNIWLVDDDFALGSELARLLKQFGYEVRLFHRLDEAESAAQKVQPDALIMDVLFHEEGVNATEEMQVRPAFQALHCPILFISAHGDFHSRLRAVRLGAKGFLTKPLDVPKLVDQLERIFDERQGVPYHILIVDDDVHASEHYRLVLSAAGMEVEVLNRPDEIIQRVSEFHPDLILMDMYMPDYSGAELAAVIRHHDDWIGLPIIYLSAEADIDEQIKAMGRGADDFITKPISDTRLVASVRIRAARARQLSELMSKDSLTGLLKHSRIKEEVVIELSRSRRTGAPFSVVMVDIDHFKNVNDSFGHAVGDRIIRAIAQLLKQRLRKSDVIGRYGGEEFLAILPECDAELARRIMDDIRERFAVLRFQHEKQEFSCSMSVGIACSGQYPKLNAGELVVAADEAMYQAKHAGRNRVCVAQRKAN